MSQSKLIQMISLKTYSIYNGFLPALSSFQKCFFDRQIFCFFTTEKTLCKNKPRYLPAMTFVFKAVLCGL
jgi:hypothetical protein